MDIFNSHLLRSFLSCPVKRIKPENDIHPVNSMIRLRRIRDVREIVFEKGLKTKNPKPLSASDFHIPNSISLLKYPKHERTSL